MWYLVHFELEAVVALAELLNAGLQLPEDVWTMLSLGIDLYK